MKILKGNDRPDLLFPFRILKTFSDREDSKDERDIKST